MKITDFRCITVAAGWRNLTYLILETNEGILGYGEAHIVGKTHTVREYLKDVRRHIIGHDVHDIESLYQKLTLFDFGSPGQVVMTGLALVEMACWDCIGKKARLPVYQLLGGKVNNRIPAYANGWYSVERTPEAFHAAAGKVLEKGYRALKFDPFGNGNLELSHDEFLRSIQLIEAVHSAIRGKAEFFLEMHGRFAPHQAVQIARAVEKFSPGWIEEPCRPTDIAALRYVMDHTTIPIATGERLYTSSAYNELFAGRLANIVQPDISQCGGILETKKICSFAETHSMMAALHNVGGVIATAAALHLMITLRNAKILEHFNDFADESVKSFGSPYPEVVDGFFRVPAGFGWGVELDLQKLEQHHPEMEGGVIRDPGLNMFRNADWNKRSPQASDQGSG